MLDIKFIRENKDLIALGAKKKHINFDVEQLISIDDKRKEALQKVEEKRTRQNEVSQKIVSVSADEKQALLDEMKKLKSEMQADEDALKEVMKEWQTLMLQVPNIPDISVPEGTDDSFNQELRTWGEKPNFDFTPKSHVDLVTDLDLADFERGTKIAGFRGYILKNEGALLVWAVFQYVLEKMVDKGYTPMIVPSLVRRETLAGTGYLPAGEDDLYHTQDHDYLAGTAEVATMSYYSDEVLPKAKLPVKIISFADSFRREAGSHSKDIKGLFRVHEFYKMEQVILCEASHEESVKFHEELLANAEEIMQGLNIPYRVVLNCGGDLGQGQVKKYDIEAWTPSENKYRETHSASYFHDFQTRRLNIKYDDGGKKMYTHSLNNTAIAAPRVLISLLENNQTKDGTVKIPEVLKKYLNKDEIVRKDH